MKYEILQALDGTPITRLWPENEQDVVEIQRMITAGEIDADGFGESLRDEEGWERWRLEGKATDPSRKKTVVVNGLMTLVDIE